MLRDLLTISGYEVEVTRDTDISIHDKGVEGIANQKSSDMDNRLELFNKNDNAICISIHQNQFTDPKYSGAQMFYSDSNRRNENLARSIQNRFVEFLQPDNTREIKQCGKELFLCYYSKNPTVLTFTGKSSIMNLYIIISGKKIRKPNGGIFYGILQILRQTAYRRRSV